jgi:hypothetical protein
MVEVACRPQPDTQRVTENDGVFSIGTELPDQRSSPDGQRVGAEVCRYVWPAISTSWAMIAFIRTSPDEMSQPLRELGAGAVSFLGGSGLSYRRRSVDLRHAWRIQDVGVSGCRRHFGSSFHTVQRCGASGRAISRRSPSYAFRRLSHGTTSTRALDPADRARLPIDAAWVGAQP